MDNLQKKERDGTFCTVLAEYFERQSLTAGNIRHAKILLSFSGSIPSLSTPIMSDKMFNDRVLLNKNAHRVTQEDIASNRSYRQYRSRCDNDFVQSGYSEDGIRFEEELESVLSVRILSFLHVPSSTLQR